MATLKLKRPSTRVIRKPLSPARDERIKAVQDFLMRKYPDLFPAGEPVVLSIGIHRRLSRPDGASGKDLRGFLSEWCARPEYLQQIVKGGSRQGTAGKDGEISLRQIKCARFMLKRMRKQRGNRTTV